MKIVRLLTSWWNLLGFLILLCIRFSDSYNVDVDFEPRDHHSMVYKYDRMDEVRKECGSVLGSAAELKPDDNRMYGIKEELSFVNGDWWQDANGVQLMPFDDRGVSKTSSDYLQSPLNLVSFWIMDVDRAHRSKKSVGVIGIMQMGISLEGLFVDKPYQGTPHFDIWPGHSQLSVHFQGIYTESKDHSGERVMCLLGSTMLPSRQPDSADPWEWVKESGYNNQPPLSEDDQILLILHYPKTFTLTNRAIRGSIRSLNQKTNLKYFDEVHISSWLGTAANYEFGSGKIVSKACSQHPSEDPFARGGIDIYKGLDFCLILERFTHGEAMTVVPNWRCNGTDEFCSKLGPFVSDKEIRATDGGFNDVKLVLQDVRCESGISRENAGFSRVSAVFRVVPPFENPFNAARRTGLNNMTLSAEGIWNSSSGLLCMVGCLGFVDAEHNGCNSRISLFVPLLFSVKQRSIARGTISSIDKSTKSYFPLSFEKLMQPAELWDQYTAAHPYYRYSKIDKAGAILEKDEPFNFGTVIKKSLLKFPKLDDKEAFPVSLSYLAEDLTLQIAAIRDHIPDSHAPRTVIQMEIISIGPLFGRYLPFRNGTTSDQDTPYHGKAEYTEKQLLLNVSAQLSLTGKPYNNFSVLFLEGLYDQHVGKMYLVGCRDVRASWKILYESMDLEAGLDCLVEVVVSYPPTTARWLISPTVWISISSRRTEDDPLYFRSVKLQSFPLVYRKQREDILARRGVEGILRILTLSVTITCVLSQLFYIRDNLDSVPYTSLVMLGVQALGYSLPLVTGAETIFRRMASEVYERPSYDLERSQWLGVIDYTVKLLVLVSFSLTLRLCQKVWKSRTRLRTQIPHEPHRVPSDSRVLLITLFVHVIGYFVVLIIHSANTRERPLHAQNYVDSVGNARTLRQWQTQLEEYVGLIHDFFLLPQIIGNLMWQINCKPLRRSYFVGITAVRVLPHVYDYLRTPISNPYFSEEYEFVNPRLDFYSKFGDIAIPATAIILATVVYIQQRWNYDKLQQALTFGQFMFLPSGSRVYERLPSKSFEAELTSVGNGGRAHNGDDDEPDD